MTKTKALQNFLPLLLYGKIDLHPGSFQMAVEGWVTSRCLEDPGFPRLLFACMDRLGIYECPEYTVMEYEDRGTPRCEITICVGKSSHYLDI